MLPQADIDVASTEASPRSVSAVLTAAFLVAVALIPRPNLLTQGVTDDTPQFYTYTVVLLLFVLLLWRYGRPISTGHLWLLVYLWSGLLLFWEPEAAQFAGAVHYSSAVLAIWAGGEVGRRRINGSLMWMVTAIAGVQFLLAVQQFVANPAALLRDGGGALYRVTGATPHPGTLGKMAYLMLFLALPYLEDSRAPRRLLARATVVGLSALIVLSLGRANIAALGTTLVLWMLLQPSARPLRSRLGLPLLVGLISIPLIPALMDRVAVDPEGGARPELLEAALRHIAQSPFIGSGPNTYVAVVGRTDPTTALGYPVHNSALLVVAEIGIIGALMLIGPLIPVLLRAFSDRRSLAMSGTLARALLAWTPGFVIIAVTGWGIAAGAMLPFAFFIFGLVDGAVRTSTVGRRTNWTRRSVSLSSRPLHSKVEQ